METYDALMTRRSVPKTTDQVPDRATIQKLLDAAVRAPNHHLTQPWRFIVLTGEALSELGDAWAEGTERKGKNPDKVRNKPNRAPVIIAVIEKPHLHNRKVIEREEHYATGAAIQNMLLAAHSMGLGAMIRTGPAAELKEVRDYLEVDDDEHIAALVYVGFPTEGDGDRPMSRRTPAEDLTRWKGWTT
jgi:nitroreductase